jgi:hypothetical protein
VASATVKAILQQGSHPKISDIKQLWAARQKGWVTDATFTQAVKKLVT